MFPRACTQCGESKGETGFYKHPFSAGGRSTKCKECVKANVRANRLKRLEYYREYDRQRTDVPKRVEARREYQKQNRGRIACIQKSWNAANPEKIKARTKVANAVRDGKLTKPEACERCQSTALRLHGHHEDYSKPLEVMWLCEPCHGKRHREINAERRMKRAA
jgi:hypothetical protein